ncbi:MAG TPA: PKD domain-containing protein, partial [Candidatus Dormibacteraeota bacterium]|nr:PKD domain-containing protein [Candidatus Dormibacteraeota bacterium]
PAPSITANNTAADAPAAISFTGSVAGGTAPYIFAWTFGDGTTATTQNPSHTYTAAGTYSVNLTVTDNVGRSAAASSPTITINNALTVVASAANTAGRTPLAVDFTSTPSGGRQPYVYAWTFGDGGTSTLQNPGHTYSAGGTYSADLTVTDANGATSIAPTLAIRAIGPLTASVNAARAIGDAPFTPPLSAPATGGQAPYTYSWDLGDGTSSTAQSPNHAYTVAGTYTATVTVSDASGQVIHGSMQITVYPALSGSASAAPGSGVAPFTVTFTGSAGGGLTPYAYAWGFGDGTTASGASAAHAYAAGTFHPTLTVRDSAGGTWTGAAGTISVSSPPVVAAPVAPSLGDQPTPPPAVASPSPASAPSPSGGPAVTPSVGAAGVGQASTPGGGNGGAIPMALLLLGSVFAAGLGGALFVGWLRRRL